MSALQSVLLKDPPLAPCSHQVTLLLEDDVFQRLNLIARLDRQRFERVIVEIVRAHVGVGG